jgi:GntR family transcriptional regulator
MSILMRRVLSGALWRQVRNLLAARIAAGQWRPGAALPSEADLAREFGVSAFTMRKALRLLEAECLLKRRYGRSFVNDTAPWERALRCSTASTREAGRNVAEVMLLEISEAVANEAQRKHLKLGREDRAYRMERVHALRREPSIVEEISMPSALFPGLAGRSDLCEPIASLAAVFGIVLGRTEESVRVEVATPAAARLLGLPAGAPVLVLDRLVYAIDGTPVEWRFAEVKRRERYDESTHD